MSLIKKIVRKSVNALGYDLHKVQSPAAAVASSGKAQPDLLLPKISAASILNQGPAVRVLEPETANGNVTLLELLVINSLVARISPEVLFEIGTFDGRTTMNITANAKSDAQTYTLDLPQKELDNTAFSLAPSDVQYADKTVSGERFLDTEWHRQIEQLYGDSGKFDFKPYYKKVQFIFVDGSHAYDYVKSDTKAAMEMAASTCLIVWHDYQPFWFEAVKCLEELHQSGGVFSGLKHVEGTSVVILPLGFEL